MKDKQFYVYIYRDPSRGNEPIYVGKGQGSRCYKHLYRSDRHPLTHRLQKMKRQGIDPVISRIDVQSESEAFELEQFMIEEIGRKDLGRGPLLNLSDGGEGGTTGIKHSQEARSKMSVSIKKAWSNPEVRAKCSAALKESVQRPEVKAKIRASMEKVHDDPGYKAKHRASMEKVYADPGYKAKIRESMKRAWSNPEYRAKCLAARKNSLSDPKSKAKHRGSSPES